MRGQPFHYQARAQPIDVESAPVAELDWWIGYPTRGQRRPHKPHTFLAVAPLEHSQADDLAWLRINGARGRSRGRIWSSGLAAPVHDTAALVELDWWIGYPVRGRSLGRAGATQYVRPPDLGDTDTSWLRFPQERVRRPRPPRPSELVGPLDVPAVGAPSDAEWMVPPNPVRGRKALAARPSFWAIDPDALNLPSPPEEGEAPVIETPLLAGAPGRPQLVGGELLTQLKM